MQTTDFYPYYQKAYQNVHERRQLHAPILKERGASLTHCSIDHPPTPGYALRFGNFPLLIVGRTYDALFWKQVAHKLGGAFVVGELMRDFLNLHEEPAKPLSNKRTSDDFLPLIGLHPILCIETWVVLRSQLQLKNIVLYGEEAAYNQAVASIITETFNASGRFAYDQKVDYTPSFLPLHRVFSVPSIKINVAIEVASETNIADEETYAAYFETMCIALRRAISYLEGKDYETSPLSLPAPHHPTSRPELTPPAPGIPTPTFQGASADFQSLLAQQF